MNDTLFDLTPLYQRTLSSHASARNAIGEVAAEFACKALRMEMLPVDGSKRVCPDAKTQAGRYLEVKSCRKGRNALLYKWRVAKEHEEFGDGYPYVFVRHECPITATDGKDIVQRFINDPPTLLIVTLGQLRRDVCLKKEPRLFKMFSKDADPRIGYNRAGYNEGGWQFSLKQVQVADSGNLLVNYAGAAMLVPVQLGEAVEFENIFKLSMK
jgi:hypothetical protein